MHPLKNEVQKKIKVLYPQEWESNNYCGLLRGYRHDSTSIYNLVETAEGDQAANNNLSILGYIANKEDSDEAKRGDFRERQPGISNHGIYGIRSGSSIEFYDSDGILCEKESYSLVIDLFSRNTGILESDFMLSKSVMIIGCGSVGSLVALELARSGVGSFFLADADILSYHNICRHQCGVSDVGKRKIDAVEERILQINPAAKVQKYFGVIETLPKEIFESFCINATLIIGCADNREGDEYASKTARYFSSSFLSIGLMKRAFAGEVFYALNNSSPCYSCLYQAREGLAMNPVRGDKRVYLGEQENFEPGISADINFVTIIGVKIALDILNMDNPNYHIKLLNHLTQFTWICNTTEVAIGGDDAEYFSYPLQVTTSMEVGFDGECKMHNKCKLFKG